MSADYSETFDALRDVYLEDSWVLALRQNDSQLVFDLDAVLTESHPEYTGPRPGEQYDYRRAELVVTGDDLQLDLSGALLTTDATGQGDMGNVDSWQTDAAGWSLLTGEWDRRVCALRECSSPSCRESKSGVTHKRRRYSLALSS